MLNLRAIPAKAGIQWQQLGGGTVRDVLHQNRKTREEAAKQ